MPIRPSVLIEFLKTFRDDAIVRGFKDGLKVKNADGTGEVVLMNDGTTSDKNLFSRSAVDALHNRFQTAGVHRRTKEAVDASIDALNPLKVAPDSLPAHDHLPGKPHDK